jgi:hypothetical protein
MSKITIEVERKDGVLDYDAVEEATLKAVHTIAAGIAAEHGRAAAAEFLFEVATNLENVVADTRNLAFVLRDENTELTTDNALPADEAGWLTLIDELDEAIVEGRL